MPDLPMDRRKQLLFQSWFGQFHNRIGWRKIRNLAGRGFEPGPDQCMFHLWQSTPVIHRRFHPQQAWMLGIWNVTFQKLNINVVRARKRSKKPCCQIMKKSKAFKCWKSSVANWLKSLLACSSLQKLFTEKNIHPVCLLCALKVTELRKRAQE